MPELLLTHGYFMFEDPKELQILKPYAPLGILYLCSHLRAKGFDVDVFDTTFSHPRSAVSSFANREAFSAGRVCQSDDAAERRRYSARRARGRLENRRRWSGTRRLRSGVSGGRCGFRGLWRRRTHDGRKFLKSFRAGDGCASEKIAGIAFLDDAGVMHQTAPRAQISRPGCAALAGPGRDRYPAICADLERLHTEKVRFHSSPRAGARTSAAGAATRCSE